MKNTRHTKALAQTKRITMSGMNSINPVGYWSSVELCCDDAPKSYK